MNFTDPSGMEGEGPCAGSTADICIDFTSSSSNENSHKKVEGSDEVTDTSCPAGCEFEPTNDEYLTKSLTGDTRKIVTDARSGDTRLPAPQTAEDGIPAPPTSIRKVKNPAKPGFELRKYEYDNGGAGIIEERIERGLKLAIAGVLVRMVPFKGFLAPGEILMTTGGLPVTSMNLIFKWNKVKRFVFLPAIFFCFSVSGGYASGEKEQVQLLIDKLINNPVENRNKEDFDKLYGLLEKRSEVGDHKARYYLSMFYTNGWGSVEQEPIRGFGILESLAHDSYLMAQYTLGHAYEYGSLGREKDNEEAMHWYKKCAEAGNWLAINRMIKAYENGELGVERQPEKVVYWKSKQKK